MIVTELVAKVRTFASLSGAEKRLASLTIGLVGAVRLALYLVPFRIVRRSVESGILAQRFRRARTERDVVWAIRLASRYIPRATCLTQAVAGQILLNGAGYNSLLCVGVMHEQSFQAHAWVEYGGKVLIGDPIECSRYRPILTLSSALSR